ncbi:MAG: hypothetical protein ACTHLR_02770 [Rhizomicrobium sp.]
MKRALALVLLAAVLSSPVRAGDAAVKSLTWSRWVDIGPGRSMAQLKPAEISALRRCKSWTMYFIPSGSGIEQVFIAGMTIGTSFPKVLTSQIAGETVFVLVQADGRTRDTLHLSKDGLVLTQISPPFRPHTYLRCLPTEKPQH